MADGVGQAVWICIVGRAAQYGTFANFTAYVQAAVVTTSYANSSVDAAVQFPDGRAYSFGWSAPFMVGGIAAPLGGFSRLDSIYAKVRARWWRRRQRPRPQWRACAESTVVRADRVPRFTRAYLGRDARRHS